MKKNYFLQFLRTFHQESHEYRSQQWKQNTFFVLITKLCHLFYVFVKAQDATKCITKTFGVKVLRTYVAGSFSSNRVRISQKHKQK